jgi:hypothetical protein
LEEKEAALAEKEADLAEKEEKLRRQQAQFGLNSNSQGNFCENSFVLNN